jgi:hypothetical protein
MRRRSHIKALLAYKKFCMEKEHKKYEAKAKRQLASKLGALQAKYSQDLSALKAKFREANRFEAGACYYTCDLSGPSLGTSDEETEFCLQLRQANV